MKPLAICAAVACFLCPASEQAEAASASGRDSDFARAMASSMEKMDADMMGAPMTGDPDHDLSAKMIPHHQGAIDMAKAFLLHGRDPALRRLAGNHRYAGPRDRRNEAAARCTGEWRGKYHAADRRRENSAKKNIKW